MISGLYTTAAGMTSLLYKNEVNANNLANTNTTGFKKQSTFSRAYLDYVQNDQGQPYANEAIKTDEVWTDFSQGTLVKTGNDLDLGIQGTGFFALETPGGVRYSRNGSFTINSNGELVDHMGNNVLGLQGKVKLNNELTTVTPEGFVYQAGLMADKIKIVNFEDTKKLSPAGYNLFKPADDAKVDKKPFEYAVSQGYLEASNVNSVESMVTMIAYLRNYEADQKAIQSLDQTLDRAVNQVGRL
jgi:flagellar basal-body rod protein FlgG